MSAAGDAFRAEWSGGVDAPVSILALSGELDLSCEEELGAEFDSAWKRSGGCLVTDLSAVTFVDVRGLHVLLRAAERARAEGGLLLLAQPPRILRRIFALLPAAEVPTTYDLLDSAVAAAMARGGTR